MALSSMQHEAVPVLSQSNDVDNQVHRAPMPDFHPGADGWMSAASQPVRYSVRGKAA